MHVQEQASLPEFFWRRPEALAPSGVVSHNLSASPATTRRPSVTHPRP
jgi:hypothetical protein